MSTLLPTGQRMASMPGSRSCSAAPRVALQPRYDDTELPLAGRLAKLHLFSSLCEGRHGGYTPEDAVGVARKLLPDILFHDPRGPARFPQNGRRGGIQNPPRKSLRNLTIDTSRLGPRSASLGHLFGEESERH